MDAAVALQRKKTIKFLCIVDFSLSKQGVFFVTLRHKTVMKKMSQSFFFAVSLKIGGFANQFLDTVLQCCPTIFGRFSHPDARYFGVKLVNKRDFGDDRYGYGMICKN